MHSMCNFVQLLYLAKILHMLLELGWAGFPDQKQTILTYSILYVACYLEVCKLTSKNVFKKQLTSFQGELHNCLIKTQL